ncbi:hypothetical protein BH10PSE14_BH10PSE14_40030 [soil metagenome]
MLLRLILAMLIAALAMPAMARSGCHDNMPVAVAMTSPAMAPSMPMEKHDSTAAEHVCAGCIPPSSWQSGVTPAPMLTPAVPLASRIATLDLAPPAPPATPPPRRIA